MENVFSDELMTEFGGAGEGFVYSVRAENAGQQIGSLREINIKQKHERYEKQKGFFFPQYRFRCSVFLFLSSARRVPDPNACDNRKSPGGRPRFR